jgi:hypothetical protein
MFHLAGRLLQAPSSCMQGQRLGGREKRGIGAVVRADTGRKDSPFG